MQAAWLDDKGTGRDTGIFHEFLTEESMAKIDERLASLETGMKVLKWAVGILVPIVITGSIWVGFSIIAIKQKLADGGVGQLVAALVSKPGSDEAEVQKSLSVASTLLERSKAASKTTSKRELAKIGDSLVSVQKAYPQLPQVWETSAQFIDYKSEAFLAKPVAMLRSEIEADRCTQSFGGQGASYNHCEISLEELAGKVYRNQVNGQVSPFIFSDSIIHYSGGNLPDGPMIFTHCLFVFEVKIVPPKRGMNVIEALVQTESDNPLRIG